MAKDKEIVLGEFWVDSDGEIFVDINDPLQAMEDMYRYEQIKKLQKKLQEQNDLKPPPDTATGFSKKR